MKILLTPSKENQRDVIPQKVHDILKERAVTSSKLFTKLDQTVSTKKILKK